VVRDGLELDLAPDEHRGRGGQVVRPLAGRPQRSEVAYERRVRELEDPLRAIEVLEAVLAEVDEPGAIRELGLREPSGCLGQEDLSSVPGGRSGRPDDPRPT
jgi:hypothetical protein